MSSPKLIQVPKKDCNHRFPFSNHRFPSLWLWLHHQGTRLTYVICILIIQLGGKIDITYYHQVTTTKKYLSSHSWKHKQWPYMVKTYHFGETTSKNNDPLLPMEKRITLSTAFPGGIRKYIYHWLSWLSMVRSPRYESLPRTEALGPEPATRVKVDSRKTPKDMGHPDTKFPIRFPYL